MDSPENFCDLCWQMWFTERYVDWFGIEETLKIRTKDLKELWKSKGVDKKIKKEILKELKELTEGGQ